jgi:hypothetical protein
MGISDLLANSGVDLLTAPVRRTGELTLSLGKQQSVEVLSG